MARRVLTVFAALAVVCQPVLAGEPEPVTSASATRYEAGHVELKVTYMGGACETTEEATVEAVDDTTDAVIIPTVATADVCTMQLVPVEFTGIVPVEPFTTTLVVTVLAFDGQPKASGSVAIGPATP